MGGLDDLYQQLILDHYRNPRNRGELETPPAHRVEGFNPLCGDEIVLYLDLDADGRVADIRIAGVSPADLAAYARTVPGLNGVGSYRRVSVTHIDVRDERFAWRW